MTIELPPLPYPSDAFEPVFGAETLRIHHGRHHRGYVERLRALVEEAGADASDLEELVRSSDGALGVVAGQHYNHSLFWRSLTPTDGSAPSGPLRAAIDASFGGLDVLRERFLERAAGVFGSGWCWLVQGSEGGLEVVTTANGDAPLDGETRPLLTADVWEHAYYLDFRQDRGAYLEAFWRLLDWDAASERFAAAAPAAGGERR